MADALPKIDLAPLLTTPLALARTGVQVATQFADKHAVFDKVAVAKDHPMLAKLNAQKELLLCLLGVVLVFHGAQFKNLLLCTQVVLAFLYDRVKTSFATIFADIQAAHEKLKADGEPEPKDTKKGEAKISEKATPESRKEDAAIAKKALSAVNSEKLSAAAVEILASAMACLLVIHGGFAQKVAITMVLIRVLLPRILEVVEFKDYEDIKGWWQLWARIKLFCILLPLAIFATNFTLAMDAAAYGAVLTTEHGIRYLASTGRVPDADAMLASKTGFFSVAGFLLFGTFWQFWTLSSGSGMAWYFQVLYFPAVIAETLLSLL